MSKAAIRAVAERLFGEILETGALAVEADILLPAGTLLDLYGEDIRARAYTTHDPARGEMMLRPDFTVPVVQGHMARGADPARYAYLGEVFRRQDRPSDRPTEYLQVGFEVFDRDADAADADVFALFARLLADLNPTATMGDFAILTAAVQGLDTTARRKAALLRHIWRPARFRALLDRFAGRAEMPPTRAALLERLAQARPEALIAAAGPVIGLREADEIAARAAALRDEAGEPPVDAATAAALDALVGLSAPLTQAAERLFAMAETLPQIGAAVDRLGRRIAALQARGIDVGSIRFVATHLQATLEYYDGMVFSFYAGHGLPPVASGGRYDALTARLGDGRSIPAVGGAIRPGLVARLRGLV